MGGNTSRPSAIESIEKPSSIAQVRWNRRQLLRRGIGLGLSGPLVLGLLTSCGGEDESDDAPDDDANEPAAAAPAENTSESADGSDSSATETTTNDGAEPSSNEETNETLIVRWEKDFDHLDPPQVGDTLGSEMAFKIYSQLAQMETGSFLELRPDLAESWEVSEDGMSFKFDLRDDAVWHQGYGNVVANDVRYSFLRHKDEAAASRFALEASTIRDVEVHSDYSLTVHMNDPYAGFLLEFVAWRPGFIHNETNVNEMGDRFNEKPIGSGPLQFDSWSPKEKVVLVRNDDYYGNAGIFSRVEYVIIEEDVTAEIALERGDIDVGYFQIPEVQVRLVANDAVGTVELPAPRTFAATFKTDRAPLDNVKVRQALSYAIDKEIIVESVLLGMGTATDTFLNQHVFGFLDEKYYSYDPERAKQLLAEAGYPDGIDTTMDIQTYPPYGLPDVAAAIQDMWREIGVTVEIGQQDYAGLVERQRRGDFYVSLGPTLAVSPDAYVKPYHSENTPFPNFSMFSTPELDDLIDTARGTVDEEARRGMYHDIQRILQSEAPNIPLFNPIFVLAHNKRLTNVVPGMLTISITDIEFAS